MEDEKRMKKVKHGKKQVITVNIYIVFSNRQVNTVAKGIMLAQPYRKFLPDQRFAFPRAL